MRLSDVVRASGYEFVIDPEPWRRPDVLGGPPDPEIAHALLCGDDDRTYIACRSDSWDWVYSCSHEIAEDHCGHVHTADLFLYQANLLAGWLRAAASDDGEAGVDEIQAAWWRATPSLDPMPSPPSRRLVRSAATT